MIVTRWACRRVASGPFFRLVSQERSCFLGHPKATHVPLYLYFLTFGLFLFFASHGRTIGTSGHSPLYMPKGTLRFIIVAGIAGVVGWLLWRDPQEVIKRMRPQRNRTRFLGDPVCVQRWWLLCRLAARSWSLAESSSLSGCPRLDSFRLRFLMMVGEALWKGFIDPNGIKIDNRYVWESILIGTVSLYFGSRS